MAVVPLHASAVGYVRRALLLFFFFSLENNSYFSVLKDITVFNYF